MTDDRLRDIGPAERVETLSKIASTVWADTYVTWRYLVPTMPWRWPATNFSARLFFDTDPSQLLHNYDD